MAMLFDKLRPVDTASCDALENAQACLAGTRTDVLADIEGWSDDSSANCMYWLSGWAGSGKSTISQSVAAMAREQKRLAASFCFSRTVAEQQRIKGVIPTIAYQLAIGHPALRVHVAAAVAAQPQIRSLDIVKQAESLITNTFATLSAELTRPLIIVLDALDECETGQNGCEGGDLIPVLLRALGEAPFRVKVFVTSRPESSITNMFNRNDVSTSTARFALQQVKDNVVRNDISLYLRHELDQLAIHRGIPLPFPITLQDFTELVNRADGLFIYVWTVTSYISSPIGDPLDQLAELLQSSIGSTSTKQYAHLDQLYHDILTKAHNTFGRGATEHQQFRDVLACLVFLQQSVNVATMAAFAEVTESVCKKIIRTLSSVLAYDHAMTESVRMMHPSLPNYLTNQERCTDRQFLMDGQARSRLAAALMRCYVHTDDARLLDEVVKLDSEALKHALRDEGNSERGESCIKLAAALRSRYNQIGEAGMLEQAIRLDREACHLYTAGHPRHDKACISLANTLWTLHNRTGSKALLEEAMMLEQEALALRPPGHPGRAVTCANLANSLCTQYNQSGQADLLEEAISLHREALALRPPGHPDRADSCANLANSLWTQYNQSGQADLLEEAISLHREALALRPPGHPDRAVTCANLANSLWTQYNQSGQADLLEEAISLHREALALRPPGHPDRADSCANLANSLWTQYNQSGQADLLEEAISLNREALALRSPGHPDRAFSCNNLATSLWTQYTQSCQADLLEEAIALQREALALRPPGHPEHVQSCQNLAFYLRQQHNQTHAAELLQEAIALEQEASTLSVERTYHLQCVTVTLT
jgi:tetratricopeptide (TPR) repeat protein